MKQCIFSLFIVVSMLFLGSCDMEQAGPLEPGSQVLKNAARGEETPGQLRIMTQNVYVGTDVDQILAAPQEEVPFVVAELFQLLQATNFPERADALAKEIKRAQPHLIGLQEVSTVRFQEEGDFIYNPEVNADLVLYDYLALLMQALQEQNLHYQVAAVVQNFDVEVPMFTGVGEQGLLFSDVRLTDFDVILASDEVICSNVSAANYYYAIDLPGLYIPRGYVAVDAEISGQVYRFVNTHLEDPSSDPVTLTPLQMAQVMELTAVLSDEDDPLIVVGDFNSQAPDGPAYNHMLAEGYQDTWLFNRKVSEEPGYTFGHAPDLQNPTAEFFERIDFVFLKDGDHTITGPVVASVIGDKQRDRTVNGLWPSDHGGLVVMFPLSPLYNQAIQ